MAREGTLDTNPGDFERAGPFQDAVAPIPDLVEVALLEGLKLATETGDTAAVGKLADALRAHREAGEGGGGARAVAGPANQRLVSNGDDEVEPRKG